MIRDVDVLLLASEKWLPFHTLTRLQTRSSIGLFLFQMVIANLQCFQVTGTFLIFTMFTSPACQVPLHAVLQLPSMSLRRPVEDDTNGLQPLLSGDSSQSTDHNGGAFVPLPPKVRFKPLAHTDHVSLFHDSDQPFYVAPGTYHK